jgi:hypothetical protein
MKRWSCAFSRRSANRGEQRDQTFAGGIHSAPFYPWESRSETYPLDEDEVATALYLANGDLKAAAALLKVSLSRLKKPIRRIPRLQHLLERMRA